MVQSSEDCLSGGENGLPITRTHTLGIRADSISASDVPSLLDAVHCREKAVLFTFVNPASVTVAARNQRYREMLENFDVVLPDGIGMCWAIRLLHGLHAARVSFDTTSLAPVVFERARQENLTVALVGGQPGVAERSADQLRYAFPALRITLVLDGYGDLDRKIARLRSLSPSIVVCGMGAGAQEQFLISLAEAGWSGIGFTCGGYLDQLATGLDYYPDWVDQTNLRWAYRLAREPRRLVRRYSVDYAFFCARLARALLSPTDRNFEKQTLAEVRK